MSPSPSAVLLSTLWQFEVFSFAKKNLLPLSYFSLLPGQIINWHVLRNNSVVIAIFSLKAWKKLFVEYSLCARRLFSYTNVVCNFQNVEVTWALPELKLLFVIGFHLQENTWRAPFLWLLFLHCWKENVLTLLCRCTEVKTELTE